MASDPPIVFKRNKPKPALRARQSPFETDGNISTSTAIAGTDTVQESPSTVVTKLKNKIKRATPKSRLSFGGEDEEGEGEAFKVKRSNLSRKVALGTHPATLAESLDKASISGYEGPKYDAAYLSELKASTPNVRPRPPVVEDAYDGDVSMDVGDVSMQSMDIAVEDSITAIPAESSIKSAREKRERLRKTREMGEEDFISLSVTKRDDLPQGPHPESRLVREEDEIGEGDDEFAEYTSAQERIALGKNARKVEAAQRRDAMKGMIEDANEEDEETAEWEQEQLRRGGHRTPEPQSARVQETYKAASIPPSIPIPTLGTAVSRLAQELAQLTTSHAQNSSTLHSLAQERVEIDHKEKEMRELVEKAEAKRAWFVGFHEWVESVAGFLDEKHPLLEKLEEDYLAIIKERFDMITSRRRNDNSDDLSTFIGPLPPPPQEDEVMDEVDELGRTIHRLDATAQRRERRIARVARRQLRQSRRNKQAGEEGYSTDSSLPPDDRSAYRDALEDLAARKKEVLADVKAEEFKDPGKGKWTVWRERYSDSYVGAWGGLGVVSVWEFWVRLESVGWDCIEDSRSLDSFKWYKGLYEYCRPGENSAVEERALGPDGDLVAAMITTAVIPMLCKQLEGGALDVYSEKHIKRVVDLAEEIEASIEESSPKFQLLLRSVTRSFETAAADSENLVKAFHDAKQGLPAFNPEGIPARMRFLASQIKLLGNLIIWRKYMGERFGAGALAGRLVEGSILGVAEGGWDIGGEELATKVVRMLPVELVPAQLKQLQLTR